MAFEEIVHMRLKPVISRMVLGMGLVLLVASVAAAQASRTWISGVGDDANPCSRTAPCKTFAGAISKTMAGGYIDVLDPGGFGAVTITKSITLDGGGGVVAGLLVSGTNGITINGAGINVTLRNLDLEGFESGLVGIRIVDAATVRVEKCNIVDFVNAGINFDPSSPGTLFVSDTSVSGTNGIVVGNGTAFFDNLRADGNTNGLLVNANTSVTVRNSYVGGSEAGFEALAASAILNIENSVSTHNMYGVEASGGGTIRLGNSQIFNNPLGGLLNDGSSFIVSLGGNTILGQNPGAFTSTVPAQ
jgi:Right handed beta helix region